VINKSKPVLISAHAAIRIALPAAAEHVRKYGRLLFRTVERLYDAHMVKAQMRLARPPLRKLTELQAVGIEPTTTRVEDNAGIRPWSPKFGDSSRVNLWVKCS